MIIPEIPEVPEEILDAAARGRLIIFVGAGASRILGCPSWSEFAQSYLEEVKKRNKINHFVYERLSEIGKRDPRKLLTICKTILKEEGLKDPNLKKLLSAKRSSKVYDYLFSIGAVNITTNFDEHFDKVLEKQTPSVDPKLASNNSDEPASIESSTAKVIFKNEELLADLLLTPGNIIHLHGSVRDQKGLIITFPDYAKHYERNSNASVLLGEIFRKTVLFVGYGLEEYEILEYIVQKAGQKSGESDKVFEHAMLFSAFQEEEGLVDQLYKYYKHMGIRLIPFSKSKNGHDQLTKVLKVWSEKIKTISQPLGFIDGSEMFEEAL